MVAQSPPLAPREVAEERTSFDVRTLVALPRVESLVAHRSDRSSTLKKYGFAKPATNDVGQCRSYLRGHDTNAMETTTDASPEQLLDELVREHLDAVYRVAYSVVRDSALAEDVAQDAILKAWRALPTFRGDSSLRSWVLRITHNTAISTLRKRREELRDPALLPEQESRSSTEAEAVQHLSIDAFEEALDQLDELSRSIIVLREVEGLSYDEIAELLGVPLPTVKTRLLRGRRVLASALTDWKP